ncbi:MAG: DUF3347 domain-containing protein [Flavobacteriaceae bacterium]
MTTFVATLLLTIACKGKPVQGTETVPDQRENIEKTRTMATDGQQDAQSEMVLKHYFKLKDALVATDNDKAKSAGAELAGVLRSFDTSSFSEDGQNEMGDILTNATEHAEHIAKSDIDHQRAHFKNLSKDIIDMVAITGTNAPLYEQYCPMYDSNEGGIWLSMDEDIRNPYFGNRMLKCGKVQRKIM